MYRCFGTPTDKQWPAITSMPYWRNNFPNWEPLKWSILVPKLSNDGIDLISVYIYILVNILLY